MSCLHHIVHCEIKYEQDCALGLGGPVSSLFLTKSTELLGGWIEIILGVGNI